MPSHKALLPTLGLVVACAIAGVFASPTSPAHAITNCETSTAGLNAAEQEMFSLINGARAAEGLAPLVLSPGLNRTAAWKSADRSAWGTTPSDPLFAHQDSLGRMPTQRANDCGYPKDAAENIAYGWGSPQATFDSWMSSSGHRANILMPYYVTVGIGEVNDRWTTNFGIYNDSGASAPAPAPTQAPAPAPAQASAPAPRAAQPAPTQPPAPAPPPSVMTLSAGTTHVAYTGEAGWSTDVFGSLGGSLRFVYTWDSTNERWLRYVPGLPDYINSLAWVEPGRDYIIAVSRAATWDY